MEGTIDLTFILSGANNFCDSDPRIVGWGGLTVSYCPECEAEIDDDLEEIGEVITCPECGVELEVISLDPVEFDLAPLEDEDEDDYRLDEEEEEDWDEEEYEDDEDDEDEDYHRRDDY
jgi:alpha-aminoadipate carrier protein LysW